jgi:uncharacterized protein (TIGR02147 family)
LADLFEYRDYRDWLRDFISDQKKIPAKVTAAKLADAIGVQKPYLSKILAGHAHFSTDQLFLLAEFLQLDSDQFEFLTLMLEFARSGLKKRKDSLQRKMDLKAKGRSDPRERLKSEFIDDTTSEKVAYFLDPFTSLLHVFLSIDEYRKDPRRVAAALHLSSNRIERLLKNMEQLGFIEYDRLKKTYELRREQIFLHKTSPLSPPHQTLARTLSMNQLMRLEPEEYQAYSISFSSDPATVDRIRVEFLSWIQEFEKIVNSGKPQGVYQLNYDLFPWA